jgi:hypothetical protein
MFGLKKIMQESPASARVAPFVVFLVLTFLQGQLGEASRFWVYLLKSLFGIYLIWLMWPLVPEMRWRVSWEAIVVGVLVCVVWVGIDFPLAKQSEMWVWLGLSKPPEKPAPLWNPFEFYGEGATWAWVCVIGRIAASTLVVPHLEEVFYRSFLYRYIHRTKFNDVPLNTFAWLPFLVTAAVFGLAHNEWLAGLLCALAYQWLVIRKDRLGDAMTAHAITNVLLGIYIVWQGAWQFW